MSDIIHNHTPTNLNDAGEARELESIMERLRAMPAGEVETEVRIDPVAAGSSAIASAKNLEPFRAILLGLFGEASGQRLDELPVIGRACQQASIRETALASPSNLASQHEAVRTEHELLSADLASLVHRKLIPASELAKGRDIQGYEATATSTLVLVEVLDAHWSTIQGKTPITREDLARARAAANALLDALSARDQGVSRLPAMEVRRRAVTLLVRIHEEIRREMRYVRYYEDDAEQFIPSLWTRPRKGRSSDGPTEDPPEQPTPPMDPPFQG